MYVFITYIYIYIYIYYVICLRYHSDIAHFLNDMPQHQTVPEVFYSGPYPTPVRPTQVTQLGRLLLHTSPSLLL